MLSKGTLSNVIECVRAAHYWRRLYPEEDLEPWGVSDKGGDTKNNRAELIGPIPDLHHGKDSKRSLVRTESARASFTMFSRPTFRSPRSTPPT